MQLSPLLCMIWMQSWLEPGDDIFRILLFSHNGCRDGTQSWQFIIKHCGRGWEGCNSRSRETRLYVYKECCISCNVGSWVVFQRFNVGTWRWIFFPKAVLKTTTSYSYNTVALMVNDTLANKTWFVRILYLPFGRHHKVHLETWALVLYTPFISVEDIVKHNENRGW